MIKKFKANILELKPFISYMKEWLLANKVLDNIGEKAHVVCEEVFLNIALHAFEHSDLSVNKNVDWISVEFKILTGNGIVIIFTDTGYPFDPINYNRLNSNKLSSSGGMGVSIFINLCDKVEYEHKNNCNILTVRIFPDADK